MDKSFLEDKFKYERHDFDHHGYYGQSEYISQSALKKLNVSPKLFKDNLEEDKVETESMIVGRAIDCLITTPDEFHDEFALSGFDKKPGGKMGQMIDLLYQYDYDGEKEIFKQAYDEVSWGQGYNLDRVYESFQKPEVKDFFGFLVKTKDKTVLTQSQYDKAHRIRDQFVGDELLTDWRNQFDEELNQLAIYWEYDGVKMRSLLDFLYVDHEKKLLLPVDLKSTYNATRFDKTARKFRYDIQAISYTMAVMAMAKELYPGYTVGDFKFIVVDGYHPPIIYAMCGEDLKIAYEGTKIDNYYLKGFKDLITEYKYHEEHGYEYPMDYALNGEICIRLY